MRASSMAMRSGGRTRSTQPVSMALRGMPSNLAVSGSWAKVNPPASLMAFMPADPSEAVPDKTTPTACDPRLLTSEERK